MSVVQTRIPSDVRSRVATMPSSSIGTMTMMLSATFARSRPSAIHPVGSTATTSALNGTLTDRAPIRQVISRIGVGILLREQRRIRRHSIDEAHAGGPHDLRQRSGVEEDLHSAIR